MNIIVLVKQVFDSESIITLDEKGKISEEEVKLVLNPYDEYAVEEGLLLKEEHGGEVIAVSLGADHARSALLNALAMGADRSLLIYSEDELDEFVSGELLGEAIKSQPYDIVLAGRVSIDNGSSQIPGRIAEKLGLPLVSCVTELTVEDGNLVATRDVDNGSETRELSLPAVITAQKGLNEPRYPSIAGIMKAKKKPMEIIEARTLCALESLIVRGVHIVSYEMPPQKKAGQILQGTAAEVTKILMTALQEEKLI